MAFTAPSRIDARDIAPHVRHALIGAGFDTLAAGEALELLSEREPVRMWVPLRVEADNCCSGGDCCA